MHGLILASTLAVLSPGAAPASQPAWVLEVDLGSAQLTNLTRTMQARGYRPIHINAYNSAAANRFAVIFQKTKEPAWDMDWALTPAQLRERTPAQRLRGYLPICPSGCN